MSRRGVWAWLCTDCDHLAADHRLRKGTDGKGRDWVCHCGCEQTQDGPPFVSLDRGQFDLWEKQHADARNSK